MASKLIFSMLIAGALIMGTSQTQAQSAKTIDGVTFTSPDQLPGTLWEGQTTWMVITTATASDPQTATRLAQVGGVAVMNEMLVTAALHPERMPRVRDGYKLTGRLVQDRVIEMDVSIETFTPYRGPDGKWGVGVLARADKSRYTLDYVRANAHPFNR
jgi:hypothetical protein